jgi:hypothetical protein
VLLAGAHGACGSRSVMPYHCSLGVLLLSIDNLWVDTSACCVCQAHLCGGGVAVL